MKRIIEFSIIGIAFFLPLSSGAVNSLIAATLVFWILDKIIRKDFRIRPTVLNLPLFLFLAISCVSIINSVEPTTSVKGLVKILKYLGIYFLMIENISDIRFAKRVITALILGAVCVCLDGVFQYIAGKDLLRSNPLIINVGLKRMTAVYRHCNDFGVYLVTIVGVIWALAWHEFRKTARWLCFLAAALVTICIALTFSRGAVLGLYGAILSMALIKKDKPVLAILILSLILMPFLIPSGVKEWGKGTASFLEFFCNKDRIAFYKSAIAMIKAHPFIGVGINTFVKAYPKYKTHDVDVITSDYCYAHNNYLQMAGEIGLIGLGIFLWVLVALFLELRVIYLKEQIRTNKDKEGKIRGNKGKEGEIREGSFLKNTALGLGCGVLAFLLNGLTESSFYFSKIVVVFWFVVGLGVSLKFVKTQINMDRNADADG